MLQKLVTTFVIVPLGIVLVAFAVANRKPVTVSFDLLGSDAPALSATVPLFLLILTLLILGVLIGGTACWLKQGKWRRAARRHEAEARIAQSEAAALRAEFAKREQPALPAPSPVAA